MVMPIQWRQFRGRAGLSPGRSTRNGRFQSNSTVARRQDYGPPGPCAATTGAQSVKMADGQAAAIVFVGWAIGPTKIRRWSALRERAPAVRPEQTRNRPQGQPLTLPQCKAADGG